MTSVLITGVNGFIGSRFAKTARSRGWNVIGSDLGEHDLFGLSDRYLSIDLGRSRPTALADAVEDVDHILHAGGVSGFMVARDQPQNVVDVNVAGTMAVFELARRGRCRRLVLCSTIMVYGPDPAGVVVRSEDEYPRPVSVYGASKVAVEALMHGIAGEYGVDAIALRFSHVYGPGRTTECFIRDMLEAASARRPYRIPQASRSLRQYVHVDDVCRSIELAFDVREPTERVFNVSAGEVHTLVEVAAAVGEVAGGTEVSFDESRDLPSYHVSRLSLARAADILGYAPGISLRDGLRHYWETAFAQR